MEMFSIIVIIGTVYYCVIRLTSFHVAIDIGGK